MKFLIWLFVFSIKIYLNLAGTIYILRIFPFKNCFFLSKNGCGPGPRGRPPPQDNHPRRVESRGRTWSRALNGSGTAYDSAASYPTACPRRVAERAPDEAIVAGKRCQPQSCVGQASRLSSPLVGQASRLSLALVGQAGRLSHGERKGL